MLAEMEFHLPSWIESLIAQPEFLVHFAVFCMVCEKGKLFPTLRLRFVNYFEFRSKAQDKTQSDLWTNWVIGHSKYMSQTAKANVSNDLKKREEEMSAALRRTQN